MGWTDETLDETVDAVEDLPKDVRARLACIAKLIEYKRVWSVWSSRGRCD